MKKRMKKRTRDDPGFELFTKPYREPHVLTCLQGIVVYKIAERDDPGALLKHHLHPEAIEQRIRDILATNPLTEFTPELQEALGINVISFQKAPLPTLSDESDIIF